MNEVHRLIEHIAGIPVWTHQIPNFMSKCRDELFRQLPNLPKRDDATGVTDEDTAISFVGRWSGFVGDSLEVESSSAGTFPASNPIADAEAMFGADGLTVIVVEKPVDNTDA